MPDLKDSNLTGENLVFIVGSPRSGTTWLQRLLATHPQVKTGQESRLFEYVGKLLWNWKLDVKNSDSGFRGGVGLPCYFNELEFIAVTKRFVDQILVQMLDGLQPGQIFLEKTPSHALYLEEIAMFLPKAKVIHLVRDPRDVTASLLAANRTWGRKWAPRRVRKAAKFWAEHVRAVEKASPKLPTGQFIEVHYEDLCQDSITMLLVIVRFLNLPWARADLVTAIEVNSADELRRGRGTPIPVHGEHGKNHKIEVQEPTGFVRKARPGSWREDLTWFEYWQIRRALNKAAPGWRKYAKG